MLEEKSNIYIYIYLFKSIYFLNLFIYLFIYLSIYLFFYLFLYLFLFIYFFCKNTLYTIRSTALPCSQPCKRAVRNHNILRHIANTSLWNSFWLQFFGISSKKCSWELKRLHFLKTLALATFASLRSFAVLWKGTLCQSPFCPCVVSAKTVFAYAG